MSSFKSPSSSKILTGKCERLSVLLGLTELEVSRDVVNSTLLCVHNTSGF